MGTLDEYNNDWSNGLISSDTICIIVKEEITSGVAQSGSVLTLISGVTVTQNNTELLIN